MPDRRRVLAVLALAAIAGAGAIWPAIAQDLDDLRRQGAVGERFDGMAVARDSSAAAFVKDVNRQREKVYAERAKAQGVGTDVVGKIFAKEIMAKAPSGTWFLGQDNKWVQK